jgi:protease PrsW
MALPINEVTLALGLGVVPSLVWLVIWLQSDREHPEPFKLLVICFILGGVAVFFATAFQQLTRGLGTYPTLRITIWAAIEEILKFLAFYIVAYRNKYNDEAIDSAIYLIAVALGFAAVENIFYVLKPAISINITASILTGGLRFFGSTLLHTISSAFIGICIGLCTRKEKRGSAIIIGIFVAIFLHTAFNFFIINNDSASFLQVYGYLWVAAIISHLILEKLRRFPPLNTTPQV